LYYFYSLRVRKNNVINVLICLQTGEQVKNMAQGAAEAVKNTLGMNTENTPTTNTGSLNHPINPSNPSNPSTRI
jgi:hypothetical protein